MGLVRGKNDKVDAIRIASFLLKNYADLVQWKPTPAAVQKLKILLTERNSRIKDRSKLIKQQKDYAKMKHLGMDKALNDLNKQQVALLNKQLKLIECSVEEVIADDEQMRRHAKLIRSILGVGKVLCWTMIARTENFTLITEARKMACYSGVVPFGNSSGTSIRGKERVSHYADKTVKRSCIWPP